MYDWISVKEITKSTCRSAPRGCPDLAKFQLGILTNYRDWNPFWVSSARAIVQGFNPILLHLNLNHCVHTCLPLIHILSQINPIHGPNQFLKYLLQCLHPIYIWVFYVFSFCQVFPLNPCIHISFPKVFHVSSKSKFSWFSHSTIIWWALKFMKLLIMQSHPIPFYAVPLIPSIFLITLLSKNLFLCFSVSVRDKVSYPHKATGKIILLCILTFTSFDSKMKDRRFWTEW